MISEKFYIVNSMIKYWNSSQTKIISSFTEHLILVFITMIAAIIISSCIIIFTRNKKNILKSSIYSLSVIYSIPSLAFFALLIPFTGLGQTTAIIVLVIYAQYVLIRNFSIGLNEVDKNILEAAKGMGMTDNQILFKIQLPLAVPGIIAGIKIATTSTIGIATIAATINAGGLGKILFDGLRTLNMGKLLWGILLTVFLCLLFTTLLNIIEFFLIKKWKQGSISK